MSQHESKEATKEQLTSEVLKGRKKVQRLAGRIGEVENELAGVLVDLDTMSEAFKKEREGKAQLIKENEQLQKRVNTLEFAEESAE